MKETILLRHSRNDVQTISTPTKYARLQARGGLYIVAYKDQTTGNHWKRVFNTLEKALELYKPVAIQIELERP